MVTQKTDLESLAESTGLFITTPINGDYDEEDDDDEFFEDEFLDDEFDDDEFDDDDEL